MATDPSTTNVPAVPATHRDVQRSGPFEQLGPRRRVTLPWERLHPVVRIAHRQATPVNIAERIILDHELWLPLAGQGDLILGERALRWTAGELHVIPPFVPHGIRTDPDAPAGHIAVHFDFAAGVPRGSAVADRRPYEVSFPGGVRLPACTPVGTGSEIEARLLRVVAGLQAGGPFAMAGASAELSLVLLQLLDAAASPAAAVADSTDSDTRAQVRMQRVADWIETRYTEPAMLADLAAIAGLSESQFSRRFRAWSGYSPMDYLKRVRIDNARALLADVDLSVKEIAWRVGFEDPFHFSRVFRQVDGLTPTQFREAAVAGHVETRVSHRG